VFAKRVNSTLADRQQHDAQEFQIYLLDALHEDTNRVSHFLMEKVFWSASECRNGEIPNRQKPSKCQIAKSIEFPKFRHYDINTKFILILLKVDKRRPFEQNYDGSNLMASAEDYIKQSRHFSSSPVNDIFNVTFLIFLKFIIF